jgi:hypothetical protein
VIISFVSNFKYGVEKNSTKFIAIFTLSFFAEYSHLFIPLLEYLDIMIHLFLHGPEHLFLPPLSSLSVDLPALLVAGLPELAVVHNDILALLSPPLFIVELLLLLSLALHTLEHLILPALVLHILVGLHLVHDHLPAAPLSISPLPLTYHLLILRSQARGG